MLSAFTIKMLNIVNKLFGSTSKRYLKSYSKTVVKINEFELGLQKLSDEELQAKTDYFRDLIAEESTLDDILPEVFAVVRETSKRTIKLRHFDLQLMYDMKKI